MKKLSAALLILLGLANAAFAQTKFTMPPPSGVFLGGYQVVTTCGAASGLVAGNLAFGAMDTTGAICTAAGGGGGGAVTQGTVLWVVSGQGTAGTAATGVVTVQGIAAMTPFLVSQATAASLNATVVCTGTFATQATLAAW